MARILPRNIFLPEVEPPEEPPEEPELPELPELGLPAPEPPPPILPPFEERALFSGQEIPPEPRVIYPGPNVPIARTDVQQPDIGDIRFPIPLLPFPGAPTSLSLRELRDFAFPETLPPGVQPGPETPPLPPFGTFGTLPVLGGLQRASAFVTGQFDPVTGEPIPISQQDPLTQLAFAVPPTGAIPLLSTQLPRGVAGAAARFGIGTLGGEILEVGPALGRSLGETIGALGRGVTRPIEKLGALGRGAERPVEELGEAIGRAMTEAQPGPTRVRAGRRAKSAPEPEPSSILPPAGSPLHRTWKMLEVGEREPTLLERFQAFRDSIKDKYRSLQETFTDRYAGINALSPQAERLTAIVGGIGDMQWQRALDISRAVREALGPPWETAARDLDTWLHLKQAIDIAAVFGERRKIPGGLKGSKEAQQALKELETYLGPERWERLERAGAAAVAESKATLNKMVRAGLVSRKLAVELLAKYPHYNKQNIIRETEDILSAPANLPISKRRISVVSANLKRLTKEGTEKARTSPFASIIGSAADAEALIARNNAARQIALDAIAQGIGERITGVKPVAQVEGKVIFGRPAGELRGTISYMDKGVRQIVRVPEWLEKEAKALSESANPTLLNLSRVLNEPSKAFFVTYNPRWFFSNIVADYLTAVIREGVTPAEELRGLIGAIKDISGNDPVLAEMRRLGAGQATLLARDAKTIAKMVRKTGNLAITSESEWRRLVREPWRIAQLPFEFLETASRVSESATRRAVYQTALKRGETKQEAVLAARRLLDFNRGGNFTRQMNNVSVFFNAGMQGLLLVPRTLRDSPRARWIVGGGLGINLLTYVYNRQFPEYEDIPRDIRYGSLIIMLPSAKTDQQGKPLPNYLTIIPRMREWSLIFGTQTYMLEALDKKAHTDFDKFATLLAFQTTPVGGPTAFVPVPLEASIEQIANYEFYRGRPIVPPEEAELPSTEQYDQYTSETIRRLAQAAGVSPRRLQSLYYALAGGFGRTATSLTDFLLQKLAPRDVDFRIAQLTEELDNIKVEKGVPPEEVPLRRAEFLNKLSASEREAVLDLLKRPEPQVPIGSAIVSVFKGERGGEKFRVGQEQAEKVTGKSAKHTIVVGKILREVFEELRKLQEERDATLVEHPDDPEYAKRWREAHKEKGVRYQSALETLKVQYPLAAQLGDRESFRQYQDTVYTIAGTIPDPRTKGQLLVAAYRAIPFEEIDPLTKDFKTFFQQREEFKAALPPKDRVLLERWLEASMTPTEKRFAKAQETLRPYWEVPDELRARHPALNELLSKYETADAATRSLIERTPLWRAFNRAVSKERESLRKRNPAIDKALQEWYGYKPVGPRVVPISRAALAQ